MIAINWCIELPVVVMGRVVAHCPDIECILYVDADGHLDEIEIPEWRAPDRVSIRADHYGVVPGMIWREAQRIVETSQFKREVDVALVEDAIGRRDEAAILRAEARIG